MTMEASSRFRPAYVTTMPNTMAQRQLVSMEKSGRPQETLLHVSLD